MAKIKIQVDNEAVQQAQASGDFEHAPPGVYIAELAELNQGYTKGDNGMPDQTRPYLECIYKIVGEGREGTKPNKTYSRIWDYVSFGESSKWKMAQFGLAMGLPVKNGKIDATLETEEGKPGSVIGKKIFLSLKAGKDRDGEYRPNVRNVSNFGEVNVLDDDEFEDGNSDIDVIDEDETFSIEIEEAEDVEAEVGNDILTLESLKAKDLEELGPIAKDFDLDPKTFIVRNSAKKIDRDKTAASLISGILSAQGIDDVEDEDENDPF